MKNLKTKIGLSVLALACLGAGTLTLQNNVSTKAEETGVQSVATTNVLQMENGAGICLENTFSGIRWATTIKAGNLFEGKTMQFGVVVAPTSTIEGELTLKTSGALDLRFDGTDIAQDAKQDVKYYSVINYNNLEGSKQAAYALELTARAYAYEVDEGEVIYSDISNISTSRSARQIAINAENKGTIDKLYRTAVEGETAEQKENREAKAAKAVEYYGGTKYTLADTKKVFDSYVALAEKDVFATTSSFDVPVTGVTSAENLEVLVDAERVTATYADGKVTITDLDYVADGEHYVSVFQGATLVDVQPMIYATKVIRTADDLKIFNAKGSAEKIRPDTPEEFAKVNEFPGYYVLGDNIDVSKLADGTAYIHGSKKEDGTANNASWQGYDKYIGQPIGLTGTFNGLGYRLTNLTIGTKYDGLFGIVNGGTVKNTFFYYVKAASGVTNVYTLGQYVVNATIENLYINVHGQFKDPKNAMIASYAVDSTFTDCVLRYRNNDSSNTDLASASLFTAYRDNSNTFENIFVWAEVFATGSGTKNAKGSKPTLYSFDVIKTVIEDDQSTPDVNEAKTSYAYGANVTSPFLPLALQAPERNKLDQATGEPTEANTKGKVVYAENQVEDPTAKPIVAKEGFALPESAVNAYNIYVYKGVFSYNNATEFAADGHSCSSFNKAFWKIEAGAFPAWPVNRDAI